MYTLSYSTVCVCLSVVKEMKFFEIDGCIIDRNNDAILFSFLILRRGQKFKTIFFFNRHYSIVLKIGIYPAVIEKYSKRTVRQTEMLLQTIHPLNRFLFLKNRKHDAISVYKLNRSLGVFSKKGETWSQNHSYRTSGG